MSEAEGSRRPAPQTVAALVAFGAAVALGLLLHGSPAPAVTRVVGAFALIGRLWIAALRMTVLPLMIGLTLVSIVGVGRAAPVGRLGLKAVGLFTAMLAAAGLLTLVIGAPLVSLYDVDAQTAASFRAASPGAPPAASPAPSASVGDWIAGLIPANVFQAAAAGEILPILLFTVLFGLAVTRLAPERRRNLGEIFQAATDAMLVLVGWVLRLLPLGVFALGLDFAFRIGVGLTGALGFFIVVISGMMILVTALLYPATAILGRVSPRRFARAVAPAQLVAVSSRSSIAALPALMEGGQKHLGLSEAASGFLLPLSVTVFKLNRAISSPINLLFLAHVYQVPLGASQWGAFLLTQFLLSFSTAGIPSAGAVRGIPAYLAVGIPLEGIVLLNAVEAIPDIFKTLTNVTGDMSAVTILWRTERERGEAVPPAIASAAASLG
jgi:proton glutamate symport protein